MKNEKKHKLLYIVIILLVVLIVLIGITVFYFIINSSKGNKDMFFEYLSQSENDKNIFYDSQLKKYLDAKNSIPYENSGSISFNITDSYGHEKYEKYNDMNITFSGKTKLENAKWIKDENISLNYSDDVKIPLIYRQGEWLKGIQTDYIGSKFIAVLRSSSLEIKELEKIQKFNDMKFTEESFNYIINSCLSALNLQSQEESFSKIQTADNNGYKLVLSGQDLKNAISTILQSLQNDETLLEELNFYIELQNNATPITYEKIDEILQDIEEDPTYTDKNLEITLYQKNGNVNRISMKTDNFQVNIYKILENDKLQYNIELELTINSKKVNTALNVEFLGLQSEEKVTENCELKIETDDTIYDYKYNNEVEFKEDLEVPALDVDNTLSLEDMEEEQKNNIIEAVEQRIQDVNKQTMEELGLEENQNPLQYVIPQLGLFSQEGEEEQQYRDVDINSFNSRFENYESTNLQGVTVKGLLTTISLNNNLDEDEENSEKNNNSNKFLIKEIHFDGTEYEVNRQNITAIKSSIETESYYRVEFERDENTGLIYRAVINKK